MPDEDAQAIPDDVRNMTDEQLRAAGMTDAELRSELDAAGRAGHLAELKTMSPEELSNLTVFSEPPPASTESPAERPEGQGSVDTNPTSDPAQSYGDGSCGGFPPSDPKKDEDEREEE